MASRRAPKVVGIYHSHLSSHFSDVGGALDGLFLGACRVRWLLPPLVSCSLVLMFCEFLAFPLIRAPVGPEVLHPNPPPASGARLGLTAVILRAFADEKRFAAAFGTFPSLMCRRL